MGRAPDASGIEQRRSTATEATTTPAPTPTTTAPAPTSAPEASAPASRAEAEQVSSFDEERSVLLKGGFEGAQVDDSRVHLDLSEVRIHRSRQGHARGRPVEYVHARATLKVGGVAERISPGSLHEQATAECIGDDL